MTPNALIWYNMDILVINQMEVNKYLNIKVVKQKLTGEKWRVYTTIDGNQCHPKQRVGYCWSETHRGYLTLPLMRAHECIEKGCKHFQKYEQAPYWKDKEVNKAKKKIRHSAQKQQEKQEDKILQKVRAFTKEDENFFAISVHKELHRYVVQYIRFEWVDIAFYARELSQVCGVQIYLKEIKNSYAMKQKILSAQGFL